MTPSTAGATWTPGQHHKADPRQLIPIYRAKSKKTILFSSKRIGLFGEISVIMASWIVILSGPRLLDDDSEGEKQERRPRSHETEKNPGPAAGKITSTLSKKDETGHPRLHPFFPILHLRTKITTHCSIFLTDFQHGNDLRPASSGGLQARLCSGSCPLNQSFPNMGIL